MKSQDLESRLDRALKTGDKADGAVKKRTANVPTLPLRVTFREALLMILASGEERGHGELLAYFAPEDAGGAAQELVRLAEQGEITRTRNPGEVWRYRRTRT